MATAPRTVTVAVGPDLHVAYDTGRLRAHTAWRGPGLILNGSPYRGKKVPFYCEYEGDTLWQGAPFVAWGAGPPPGIPPQESEALRYRGLSTRGGQVTLRAELSLPGGTSVRVLETPVLVGHEGREAPARVCVVEPCDADLWFLVQAAAGSVQAVGDRGTIRIAPAEGAPVHWTLVGPAAVEWHLRNTADARWREVTWSNAKNDSVRIVKKHQAPLARAYVRIPARSHTVRFAVHARSMEGAGSDLAPPSERGFPDWDGLLTPPEREKVAQLKDALQQRPELTIVVPGAYVTEIDMPALKFQSLRETVASDDRPTREKRFPTPPERTGPDRAERFELAADRLPVAGGNRHYRVEHFPLPKEVALQVTGMDFLPDGNLAVCTWQGEVYIVENPHGDPGAVRLRRFARGLCEPGGLKVYDGRIHLVQKVELTRLADIDGDGEADLFDCLNQDWGVTGNYHDFSFGPLKDRDGNFVVYRTGNRGIWEVPYMGWAVTIPPDGRGLEGYCSGFRSPNGFGVWGPDHDLWMGDNQGNWVGACTLHHIRKGLFYGFPSTRPLPRGTFENPQAPPPPAVWFPYELAPSVSDIATFPEKGFGPFGGQMVVGDWKNALLMRVQMEKVGGEWQGCVWPLAKGFWSGVNRIAFGPDNRLYVGGCKNPAWAALGPYEASLDRVGFTGRTPFEVQSVHARPDGFVLEFTEPVDAGSAADPAGYDLLQFRYEYHQAYGSPKFDHDGKPDSLSSLAVKAVEVAPDRRRVRLRVGGWKPGYVTWIRPLDVENEAGDALWHDEFWYTLNRIPER